MILMPDFYEKLLPVNWWSRPGIPLNAVLGIVMHWTQPKGDLSTPGEVWAWWYTEGKVGHFGSAQYIIGRGGEVLRTVPELEVTRNCGSDKLDPASGRIYTDLARKVFGEKYCDNNYGRKIGPNAVTIGIEMIPVNHLTGEFSKKTLRAAARLVAGLKERYPLATLLDHNLVVGYKDCPRAWVRDQAQRTAFAKMVEEVTG